MSADGPMAAYQHRAPPAEPTDEAVRHARKLARITHELRHRDPSRPVSFRKAAVPHQVPKRTGKEPASQVIDIRDLSEILELDLDKRVCTAEPGVTFEALCRRTLGDGLIPAVVPELRTITVGGAVSGCSIESMSWRHGGFHDTCREYEIIGGDGTILRATPESEHQLVFEMMHGTFGTLGLISKLSFDLVPAKRFVHVVYEKHRSLRAFQTSVRHHVDSEDLDFMDGIFHAIDCFVLATGRFIDTAPYTNRYDWTKVYYASTRTRTEDYLETEQYLFRYDRGVTNVHPKSFLGRLFLGKLMSSSNLLRLATMFPSLLPSRPDVTLDVFVPFSRVPQFMEWHTEATGFFPVWCVPYRRVRDYAWLAPSFYERIDDDLFLDLAIYGLKQPPGRNVYKEIEEELLRVNGVKTLISHNYYDEETFWKIWNRPNFERVKSITDPANAFGDLFAKMVRRDVTMGAAGVGAQARGAGRTV